MLPRARCCKELMDLGRRLPVAQATGVASVKRGSEPDLPEPLRRIRLGTLRSRWQRRPSRLASKAAGHGHCRDAPVMRADRLEGQQFTDTPEDTLAFNSTG